MKTPSVADLRVDPLHAAAWFRRRLAMETDPFDVQADLDGGTAPVIIDPRPVEAYELCHIRGAISLPYRSIDLSSVARLPQGAVFVTYGWGPACNAGTKAAARLAALGFPVKEMIGGLEYWRREGRPVDGTLGDRAPLYG